jgi:hypothetical protein
MDGVSVIQSKAIIRVGDGLFDGHRLLLKLIMRRPDHRREQLEYSKVLRVPTFATI